MNKATTSKQEQNMRISQIIFIVFALISQSVLAIDADEVMNKVKSMPCKNDQTVDQILEQTIRSRAQRDIGWRRFQEDNYVDVERAVLITKGMEFRYRWRAQNDGSIAPQNERTEKLCSNE
ncbi:MAG: hypothetical protein EBR59_01400 [Methylococcaceae bacterium]|jgi:hypothetical protein|nr:hypothetical protein [Methylococcaceae bacterium]